MPGIALGSARVALGLVIGLVLGLAVAVLANALGRGSIGDALDIMGGGASKADDQLGYTDSTGATGFQVHYRGTDADGVASYDVTSPDNGHGTQALRVLTPTDAAPGVDHNFLFVLPVEAGLGTEYGDGLETLHDLDAQDHYNLTIIEPTFGIEPWYADNPIDSSVRYETFMTKDLLPWVTHNLALSGHEQNWLIGFSKSGIGAEGLILKHPDLFTLAASWDFPADMSTYDQYPNSSDSYGTNTNFEDNYRLTPAFVDAHKAPFLSDNRIWIGGYSAFRSDMSDYGALLTSEGMTHTRETPQPRVHSWDSGWMPVALAALRQDSTNLSPTPTPARGTLSSRAHGHTRGGQSGAVASRPAA